MRITNWRQVPFIRLIIPFLIGIVTALYWDSQIPFVWLFITIFTVGLLWQLNERSAYTLRWIRGGLISALLFLLGYQLTFLNQPIRYNSYYGHFTTKGKTLAGKIIDIPIHQNSTKLLLEIEYIVDSTKQIEETNGKLLCYLERDSVSQTLVYGDKILIKAIPQLIEPPSNPAAFDYKSYLKYKKIHYQVYAKTGQWQKYETAQSSLFQFASQFRLYCLQRLEEALGEQTDEYAVGSALILGYKAALSDDIRAAYAQTGAIHILAVSGLHVGIIAWIFNFLLGLIKWNFRFWIILKIIVLLGLMWGFALLTGLSASVLRATVMFSFIAIAHNLNFNTNIYNTLAISAFVLLVWNPYLIMDVGFQLSYVAVIGIVFFQPLIVVWWQPNFKFIRYFWELTAVSMAATLATLPLTLYYFHQFPIWFWLSSMVAIPAAMGVLVLGLIYLTIGILPFIDTLSGQALYILLYLVNSLIKGINYLPYGLIKGVWIESWQLILLIIAISSFGLFLIRERFKWLLLTLGVVLIIVGFSTFQFIKNGMQQQMVIYDLNRHSAIDFIDGHQAISLQDTSLDVKNYEYASKNYHAKRDIQYIKTINFKDSTHLNTIQMQEDWIQFSNIIFKVIDEPIEQVFQQPINVDYVLIRNNPKLYIKDVAKNYKVKQLIFDGSNAPWRVNYWKRDCEELGIDYDIGEEGVFILDMKNG